jgi:hypothetical protein
MSLAQIDGTGFAEEPMTRPFQIPDETKIYPDSLKTSRGGGQPPYTVPCKAAQALHGSGPDVKNRVPLT